MKQTRWLMGIPITVEIRDGQPGPAIFNEVFTYFQYVDDKFSTYKPTSEISKINEGILEPDQWSPDMRFILEQCEKTKQQTNGFFDIHHQGRLDPSGLVKGWSIEEAGQLIRRHGFRYYSVTAGGDITVSTPSKKQPWRIGIRHPDNHEGVVKVVSLAKGGMATSGTYIRGQHIYNPHQPGTEIHDVLSLTVIGPTIYDADRFATAAFAMGRQGIHFIEQLAGFEAYQINSNQKALMTSGFEEYTKVKSH